MRKLLGCAVWLSLVLAGTLSCAVAAPRAVPSAAGKAARPPDWQYLYAGDFGAARIYRIAPDGTSTVYAEGIPAVNQLVFDASGTLYVAGGPSIWKITPTPDGSPATVENGHVRAIVSGLSRARALARDLDGNFWVSEYMGKEILDEDGKSYDPKKFEPGDLLKVSPDGTKTTVDSPLSAPYGLATAADGDIYLAQLGGFSVYRYTPQGAKTLVAKGIYWCRNLVFDPSGVLYVIGGHGITKVNPDGTKTVFCDWQQEQDAQRPKHTVGLAFDANGTLYSSGVAHDKQDKDDKGYIYSYAPDGARTVFCRAGRAPFYLAFYPTAKPDK